MKLGMFIISMIPILLLIIAHSLLFVLLIVFFIITLILIYMTNELSWIEYMVMLVYVGGMLVIYVYITSMAPNWGFNTKLSPMFMFPLIAIIVITTQLIDIYTLNMCDMATITKMSHSWFSTSVIIFYLLFILFVSVKIISKNKYPMRKI